MVGCTVDPPIEYETKHLRVGGETEYPLCKGDLDEYEEIIDRVETELGFEVAEPIKVFVYDDDAWWAGGIDNCDSDDALGCWKPSSRTIHATHWALEHELVHAVFGDTRAEPFFEEAISDMYGGMQTRFGTTAPSDNRGYSRRAMDEQTGRHFVRWLRDRWGEAKLGDLVRAPGSEFDDDFEVTYGMTIEAAETIYFDEAPWGYSSLYECTSPRLRHDAEATSWRETIDLDCAMNDETRSRGTAGMHVRRTFDVLEPGYHTITHTGDAMEIHRCSPERIEDAAGQDEHLYDDVPPSHASFPSGASRYYEGQQSLDLYMEAGVHEVDLAIYGHGSGSIAIEVFATLGPHPVAG